MNFSIFLKKFPISCLVSFHGIKILIFFDCPHTIPSPCDSLYCIVEIVGDSEIFIL